MHKHRTSKAVRRLNLTALHFMFNILLAIGGLSCLSYGLISNIRLWQISAGCVLGFWLFSVFLFFIRQSILRCPLCMVPLWGNQKCKKNSKMKPALGISYRLGTACSIIFRGRYRCPYCGEPFDARKSREK